MQGFKAYAVGSSEFLPGEGYSEVVIQHSLRPKQSQRHHSLLYDL